ncbi:TRAP transporter substrate-binding protein [Ammoniphilus resinae]|uniref:Tripartite ATP-independent transporter DctP family solute receptor n=1 Tax=Ammoniphilus resinae TaxID=861532 RepID=A0ABS4GR25_9BACL|nr:TRAP transporter substrate-binding protein [Ammoniphilus resinae]MBP1932718.1 tripartite ATP-independent transporter DctP family solute receptor [Ammoniphilus resinae]
MAKGIRVFSGFVAIAMAASLVGCGGGSSNTSSSGSSSSSSSGGEQASSGGSSSGGSEAALTVRLATTSAKGGALYEGAVKFSEIVKEKSNGTIDVQVFPDGQLGKDLSVLDAQKTGTVEMSIPSTAMAQKSPEFGVFDIPFLFENREKVQNFANGEIWKSDLLPLFEKHGLVGLGFWENGFRQITNNTRPINTPEDLEGIKLRVPESKLRVAAFKVFGANPTTMDFSEVFTALQQGVVDGQENPLGQIEAGRFYEIQKYLSITNHTYTPGYLVASKMWWDKLTPDQQKILSEAAVEAGDYSRTYGAQADDELLKKFKDAGMEVNDADVKSFQAKVEPVIDELKKSIDPGFVDKVVKAAQE